MKRINFNHISIRNFLSIGNEPVKINFTPGLHIITGINRDKPDRQNELVKRVLLSQFILQFSAKLFVISVKILLLIIVATNLVRLFWTLL